jgi:hypothetical protein
MERSRTVLKYFFAWFGMMVIAVVNGGLRDFVYKPYVGDLSAHQISTAALVLLLAGYYRILAAVLPLRSASQAWIVGVMWLLMTEAFEFGMGRLIEGASWNSLFHAYNLCAGQVWLFIPLWVLIGPYVFFRFVPPHSIANVPHRGPEGLPGCRVRGACFRRRPGHAPKAADCPDDHS